MHNFLYPSKENILDLLNSDIHYKNYNTFDYINNLNNKNEDSLSIQTQRRPNRLRKLCFFYIEIHRNSHD